MKAMTHTATYSLISEFSTGSISYKKRLEIWKFLIDVREMSTETIFAIAESTKTLEVSARIATFELLKREDISDEQLQVVLTWGGLAAEKAALLLIDSDGLDARILRDVLYHVGHSKDVCLKIGKLIEIGKQNS